MTYRVNRTNPKQGSSLGTAKHNRHPALSPLATAVKVAIVGVSLAVQSTGHAATIEVNTNLDNGSQCTLRDAIVSVNEGVLRPGCVSTGSALGTDDTINVGTSIASDTITLENGELEVTEGTTVSINGNGVTVDANQQSRAFFVIGATLSIDNMSITGGNTSRDGGGIRVWSGNTSLSVSNSTIFGNSASYDGGGIHGGSSVVSISNSTISGNSAKDGGGIYLAGRGTISNSTISDNLANDGGSGIGLSSGNLTIANSTISGNEGSFGAVDVDYFGDISISHSTISDTVSTALSAGSYSSIRVDNSIAANSTGSDCRDTDYFYGTVITDSASIIESDGGCETDARAVDPLLLPLADNGCAVMHTTPNGPACVMTHALAAGSPAIDTAVDSDLETDQIGTLRPQGAADVGAFELPSIVPTSPGFTVTTVNAVEGEDINVLFTITLDEPQPVAVGYDFRTEAGTAIDGEDYVGRVGRAIFPAGVTVRERRVTVLEDGVSNEDTETFSMVVSDINDPSLTLTTEAMIMDGANTVPQISVEEVRVNEGDEKAVVVISLSEPSSETVSVRFANGVRSTQNNPATPGDDYIARSGNIIFPAGTTRRTRTITLIDDNVAEANEVFRFELSAPSNAEIAEGSERQRVFILNDD